MSLRYPWFWKSLAWVLLLTVATATLMPSPPRIELPLLSWDKAQHFIAYAVLMWIFLQAWEGRHTLAWAILLVTVGVGLEILQGWMGVRFMEYFDMLANSLGVLLGYLAWRTPLGRGFHRIEAGLPGR
jgi:VanZ family protein